MEETEKDILDRIPQMVWRSDTNANIQYSNQRWKDYIGTEVHNAMDPRIVHPNDRQHVHDEWEKAQTTKEEFSLERRL